MGEEGEYLGRRSGSGLVSLISLPVYCFFLLGSLSEALEGESCVLRLDGP